MAVTKMAREFFPICLGQNQKIFKVEIIVS